MRLDRYARGPGGEFAWPVIGGELDAGLVTTLYGFGLQRAEKPVTRW